MLRKYLDDRQRQGSVILPATIDSHRPDGDENVRIRHTGQVVRASRGNTGGTYEIGQVVQVSRTDASGVTSNTGWVIIGPPPTSMRGSSSSAPLTETKTHSGTAITLIVPNPVPLVAGGDSVTVTLHGVFAGVTGVSFGTSEIVNDVPPTATDSEITLEVRATVGAVPGDYDLLLDGAVVAPGLFEVSSAVVSVPDHSLWALAYDASFATQYLLRIDPADMSVFRTYPLANAILTYLSVKSGVIYAKVGGEFVRIDIATGDVLAPVSCTPSMDDSLTLGDIGDLLFYGGGDSGSPTLIEFDASLNSESSSALPSGSHSFRAAAVDSGGALLWICGGTHFIKWDIGTSSALITLLRPAAPGMTRSTRTLLNQAATCSLAAVSGSSVGMPLRSQCRRTLIWLPMKALGSIAQCGLSAASCTPW